MSARSTTTILEPRARDRSGRLWEIDLARTIAIAMMIGYHVAWDLDFLAPGLGPDPLSGPWRALQVATGSLFLLLVGVSFAISDARARALGRPPRTRRWRQIRRGLFVLAAALVVSGVTFLVLGDRFVRFGILHLIGTSIILLALATPPRSVCAPLGLALILGGLVSRRVDGVDLPGALVLGLPLGSGAAGVDYYPLLPWFGVVVLGVGLGLLLYPVERYARWSARMRVPAGSRRLAGAAGRHSLSIYLVHQPILIGLIALALLLAGQEVAL